MRIHLFTFLVALMGGGCHQESSPKVLDPKEVQRLLNAAYALEDNGDIMGADSVYLSLLSHELSPADSAGVSSGYLSVLFKKGDFLNVILHVDRAFPVNSAKNWDLLRRHSFRFEAYLAMRQCDSVYSELAKLFQLVAFDSTLQLSMSDLTYNRSVVDSICSKSRANADSILR